MSLKLVYYRIRLISFLFFSLSRFIFEETPHYANIFFISNLEFWSDLKLRFSQNVDLKLLNACFISTNFYNI